MKRVLMILFLVGLFSSCKDKCLICPENYVIKNDVCHCESDFIRNGHCYKKEYLSELDYFIQEKPSLCSGFEELISLKYLQHNYNAAGVLKENIGFFDETSAAGQYRLFKFGSDSFYAPSWHITGVLGVSSNLTLEPFKKVIDGKTCYLRFNTKVVSPNHLRLYFFWMTKNDVLKSGYCIRNFYQPY
jgi:hypothetical protein